MSGKTLMTERMLWAVVAVAHRAAGGFAVHRQEDAELAARSAGDAAHGQLAALGVDVDRVLAQAEDAVRDFLIDGDALRFTVPQRVRDDLSHVVTLSRARAAARIAKAHQVHAASCGDRGEAARLAEASAPVLDLVRDIERLVAQLAETEARAARSDRGEEKLLADVKRESLALLKVQTERDAAVLAAQTTCASMPTPGPALHAFATGGPAAGLAVVRQTAKDLFEEGEALRLRLFRRDAVITRGRALLRPLWGYVRTLVTRSGDETMPRLPDALHAQLLAHEGPPDDVTGHSSGEHVRVGVGAERLAPVLYGLVLQHVEALRGPGDAPAWEQLAEGDPAREVFVDLARSLGERFAVLDPAALAAASAS